ncbi:twitching motility protein PilT [Planctomycetota bacterium]|nr:twitching motility protein PilT [Planctomycetota bacterium]
MTRSARSGPWLLDTNTVIFFIKGRNPALTKRILGHHVSDLRVSDITIAELEFGSLKAPFPNRHRARWRHFLGSLESLPFDAAAAVTHARARLDLRHQPIGERDLLIAAIALAHDLTVVTSNLAEFSRVPGLRCEDWSTGG